MPTHHYQPNSTLQGSHSLLKGGDTLRRRGFKNLSGGQDGILDYFYYTIVSTELYLTFNLLDNAPAAPRLPCPSERPMLQSKAGARLPDWQPDCVGRPNEHPALALVQLLWPILGENG